MLGVLGGADQALFFGVPTGKHHGAPGTPSGFQQFANAVHGLQHGRRAAAGIGGAKHPGIAMIAGNHPLLGILRAPQGADHVPDGPQAVILRQVQADFGRSGTNVIGKRQRALPLARRNRAAQLAQDRRSVSRG